MPWGRRAACAPGPPSRWCRSGEQPEYTSIILCCFLTNIIVPLMLLLDGCATVSLMTSMDILNSLGRDSLHHGLRLQHAGDRLQGLRAGGAHGSDPHGRILLGFDAGVQSFCGSVPDTRDGSYMTMPPGGGMKLINIMGNFGTFFVHQSYWRFEAVAASMLHHP